MSINLLNSRSDNYSESLALIATTSSASALSALLQPCLGPTGKEMLLVGGAGQLKMTKDGNVLLKEMQIQHPISQMIARCATAQDDNCGDHTISCVMVISSILKAAERAIGEGISKKDIVDGLHLGYKLCKEILLNSCKTWEGEYPPEDIILSITSTALRTKLDVKLANQLSQDIITAIKTVSESPIDIDPHRIEIMVMKRGLSTETQLIKGLVLDHGCRHPDMPSKLDNVYILILNVSLEYEKTEINSGFFYSDAYKREEMVINERNFTDEKVRKIIQLKRKLCDNTDKKFAVFNQKGIDPASLDMLAKEGIMALRRIKRRNLERLMLLTGGNVNNSVENLTESDIGFAGKVYEDRLDDDVFTFVDNVNESKSCTFLIRGQSDYVTTQINDAIRDGIRAARNLYYDKCYLPGAGACEMALYRGLKNYAKGLPDGRRAGVLILAEAFLSIPRCLAQNASLNAHKAIIELEHKQDIMEESDAKALYGIDIINGETLNPIVMGILDTYSPKKQILDIAIPCVEQLLLVDVIIRAGKNVGRGE